MSSYIFRSPDFRCRLQCGQCDRLTASRRRCRNRVCFGTPACWQHRMRDEGLRIARSTLKGAGKGLFAAGRSFRRGQVICTYDGEALTAKQIDQRYRGDVTAPYALCSSKKKCMDGACRRGIATMVNGTFDGTHNVVFKTHRGRLIVKAVRHIPDGTELLADYGREYRLDLKHSTS